ncbi:hypothetical protein ACFL52_05140 [Candidatus Margulisiibacteriota bacterium]
MHSTHITNREIGARSYLSSRQHYAARTPVLRRSDKIGYGTSGKELAALCNYALEISSALYIDRDYIIEHGRLSDDEVKSWLGNAPIIGVLDNLQQDVLVCLSGAELNPNSNFLFIPRFPKSIAFTRGRLYVNQGILFKWDEAESEMSMGYAVFPTPVEVHNYYDSFSDNQRFFELLSRIGIPSSSIFLNKTVHDKALTHSLVKANGVTVPKQGFIHNPGQLTAKDIKAIISRTIGTDTNTAFVLKPNFGMNGQGVKKYNATEIDEAVHYLQNRTSSHVIEEWIDSHPWTVNGLEVDWNLRVLVPPGALSDWDMFDTTEVRYKANWPGPAESSAVSKSTGARITTLDAVFKELRLDPKQQEYIISQIRTSAEKIREALYEHLKATNHNEALTDVAGNSYFKDSLLGLDFIINDILSVFLLEVNGSNSGGFSSLARIRENSVKSEGTKKLVRYLASSARTVKEHFTASPQLTGRIRYPYLYDAQSFWGLGCAHIDSDNHEAAISAFSESIRLDPKMAKAYVLRGKTYMYLGKYRLAFADFDKAFMIDHKDIWRYIFY